MNMIVIGGGVIGLMTAIELMRSGVTVTLVERGQIGREASWAGGGILWPLYPWRYPPAVVALAQWSRSIYPELAAQLWRDTGIDSEWENSGLLMLDTAQHPAALAWAAQQHEAVETLPPVDLKNLEPALAPFQTAVRFPAVAQIRNPYLLQALQHAARQMGIQMIEQCAARTLKIKGDHVAGVRTSQGDLEADGVVVAAGAWSSDILPSFPAVKPITPARGQMLLLRAPPGEVRHITLHEGRYLIPRRDGRILVGSTVEHVGFDKTPTAEARTTLLAFAQRLFPGLRHAALERHWAGLRPSTEQGVPYIGPVPGLNGLFLNSGHFRNGLVMAPAAARLVVDMILQRPPIMDPHPYTPLVTKLS